MGAVTNLQGLLITLTSMLLAKSSQREYIGVQVLEKICEAVLMGAQEG